MAQNTIPVTEYDFLDQDPALRSQNYVCLSFVSPEEVLKKKEVYFFEEFVKTFSSEITEFVDRMMEKYVDDADALKSIKDRYSYLFNRENMIEEYNFFVNSHSNELEDAYYKQNNFQTSIRGLKVRGVFDTLKEAEIRAQVLKRMDDKFHVYVAQVGCWCPWSPNPEDIQSSEYAETHLNTLMKHYKTNQEKKDAFYQERKRDMQFSNVTKKIEEKDAWMASKETEVPDLPSDVSIVTDIETPVVTDIDAPVVTDIETPVVTDIETPVVTDIETPVVTDIEAPVVTDIEAPIDITTVPSEEPTEPVVM
jgi:hypothetical protein